MHTRISTALFVSADQYRSQVKRDEQLVWMNLEGIQFRRVRASVIIPCVHVLCLDKAWVGRFDEDVGECGGVWHGGA